MRCSCDGAVAKGVVKCYPLATPGGMQEFRLISQGDVFRLITHSMLPAAERFEAWLYDKVLPEIARTGSPPRIYLTRSRNDAIITRRC